jgi:lipoprotein NlpD
VRAPPRATPSQNNAPVFVTVPSESGPVAHVPPAASGSVATTTQAESGVLKSNPPAATNPPASAVPSGPQPAIVAGRTHSVDGITWQWPADGAVISGFQDGSGGSGAGLDIAGNAGDPVRAAADGVVVYSGNGLIGYGELIIIKHSDTYLSAYGHNRKRLVKEGEHVRAGQLIAEMGSSGAPREELHFEIRKNGKPVDPADYLPGR